MIHTQSSLNTFQSCERKWKHRYMDGISPASTPDVMVFGTVWHEIMEGMLLGVLKRWGGPDAIVDRSPLQQQDKLKLKALTREYFAHWNDDGWRVVSVEQVFEHSIDGMDFSGKYDAIIERCGEMWVVEHKTTSTDIGEESAYWAKLHVDWQVHLYTIAARAGHKKPVVGVIYDVVKKPALRLTKKDRKEGGFMERVIEDVASKRNEYFARKEIRFTDEQLAEAENMLATMAARIEKTRVFMPNANSCWQFAKKCAYHPLCTGEVEATDRRHFEIKEIHEELKQ